MKKIFLLMIMAATALTSVANDYFDVKILNGDPIEEGSTITCNVAGEERYKDDQLILVNWAGSVDVNVVTKKGAMRTYAIVNCVEPGNEEVADRTKYLSMQVCYCNGGANGDENNCLPNTDTATLYTTSSVIAKDNFYWMFESKMRCTGANIENVPKSMRLQVDLYACDGTGENAHMIDASKFTFYIDININHIVEIGDTFTKDDFGYKVLTLNPNTVSLYGIISLDRISGKIEIPEYVEYMEERYLVAEIADSDEEKNIKGVFANCKNITEVNFPSTLSKIGKDAFQGCEGISSIVLPKTIESVGENAFVGCPIETLYVYTGAEINNVFTFDKLKKVVFGDDASNIPSFSGASLLTDVVLPTQMEEFPISAFKGCSSLKSLELPPALKSISDSAFEGCGSLEGLILPKSITKIGKYAFDGCERLEKIELPKEVVEIGDYAFRGCSSILTIELPNKIVDIPEGLFANCESLEKIYCSDKINLIGESAFEQCTKLRSFIIPEGLKEIPSKMMKGCALLSEILIPNSVVSIGESAFSDCASIVNIDLGTGVYNIADKAFENCVNIKSIHSMSVNPPFAEVYTFPKESYNNTVVTVQEQSLTKYNQQNPWYRFSNYLTVNGAVSLSHYQVDMVGDEVFQLGVYGANSEIEWSSSNPSVAYANKCGLIVAMGITGSTIITAHVDGEEINCRVTVSAIKRQAKSKAKMYATEEEQEVLNPMDIVIESVGGNPPMVNARLIPVGSCTKINWTSSNNANATVENGLVTLIGQGEVEFGAKTDNGLSENIESDTESIEASGIDMTAPEKEFANDSNDVYDLMGRCVLINANETQIKNLNKGVYIVNGEKVLVK